MVFQSADLRRTGGEVSVRKWPSHHRSSSRCMAWKSHCKVQFNDVTPEEREKGHGIVIRQHLLLMWNLRRTRCKECARDRQQQYITIDSVSGELISFTFTKERICDLTEW